MDPYIVQFTYSEHSIRKLATVLDKSFFGFKRFCNYLAGLILVLFGLSFGMNGGYSALCAALGAILIGSVNHRATSKARQLNKSLNGKEIKVSYSFCEDYFLVLAGKKTEQMNYSVILRLIDDGQFLYLCPTSENAFMFEKSVLPEGKIGKFKDFISEKTNLSWEKPSRLTSYTLISALRKKKSK